MKRLPIPFDAFTLPVIRSFKDQWMLLTAGENAPGEFNTMTVSWGGLGVIWNKPLAMVVVRPSRFTYSFMEKHDTFTLSAFPGKYKDQLTLCGTRSGRALDKVKASGLTPIPSSVIVAPGFDEAELIMECRKMYYDDIKPDHFLAAHIEPNYGGHDYHRMYFGEIVALHGTSDYLRK
jgi:flavin reductase (DIM6/NTAB) family NADH-FMN oxidoreductase RutF